MALLEDVVPLKDIEIERGATIDAAIVRIMKSRKVLSHVHLIGEILQHLSFFIPDPKQIKQRIEMLIEKEYLRRDITDNKSYHYMPWVGLQLPYDTLFLMISNIFCRGNSINFSSRSIFPFFSDFGTEFRGVQSFYRLSLFRISNEELRRWKEGARQYLLILMNEQIYN